MGGIRLATMVKDEAAVIERCLRSALPFIDSWTILDTGSTDGTQDIIRHVLADLPGELHHGTFENFGVTRTQVMELAAGKSEYVMLLDADTQLEHDGPLPALTADVYEGMIRTGPLDYALPIIVRNDRQWRYQGVAHTYLASDQPFTTETLPGLRIIDGGSTGPDKLHRDLELLSAEHARNPLDARTAFYLAQTYKDLGMVNEAIQAYRTRANMTGGWDEETYYARYELGVLLSENIGFSAGAPELLAAWEMRRGRVEALRALSNVAANVADKTPLPTDRLFVHHAAYRQQAPVPAPAPRLTADQVSAVIVTRGNVDLNPILATLPYTDIVIWDNSKQPADLKVYGRYVALRQCRNDIVYMQDDDILFTAHEQLLAAYEPGIVTANMDAPWVEACGYHDMVMVGAGAIADRNIYPPLIDRYLAAHPFDDEFLLEADFALGTLAPSKKVDLGFTAREFADNPDRLYAQPWQLELKNKVRAQARAIREVGAIGVTGCDHGARIWRSDWRCTECGDVRNHAGGDIVGVPGSCPACGAFALSEITETRRQTHPVIQDNTEATVCV